MSRAVTDFRSWMKDSQRQHDLNSRRRSVTAASDLLGPGLAPRVVLVPDWNDETMDFNGIYYSEVGALNTPDSTKRWIGTCHVDDNGNGVQTVSLFLDDPTLLATWTPVRKTRAFVTPDGSTRVFSAWQTL